MGLFTKLFGKKEVRTKVEESDVFDHLKYVELLCNQSLDLERKKLEEEKRLAREIENLTKYKRYGDIKEEDLTKIEGLLSEYNRLGKEKETLKSDLLLNETKYDIYKKYENRIEVIYKEMLDLEEKRNDCDHDIRYLKAEQAALKYDEEFLKKRLGNIKKLLYASFFFISLDVLALIVLGVVYATDILMPTLISAGVIVLWLLFLMLFDGKSKSDFKKNSKKQERLVSLLNKTKIKLVNVEVDLDTLYTKYNVKSAEMLKRNVAVYRQLKVKRFEYQDVFNDYFDIYEQLEEVLSKYNLNFNNEVKVIKELSDTRESIKLRQDTETRISLAKDNIDKCREEQEKIVDKLKELKQNDFSPEQAVAKLVDAYLEQFYSNAK